jgi:hypothetical protein
MALGNLLQIQKVVIHGHPDHPWPFFCQGPEVQREAIEKFRPKPGTTNVSGLLAPGFFLVGGWAQCGRRML